MELHKNRGTREGSMAYVRCLESFVLMPKAYLRTLRERGSIIENVVSLVVLKAEMCGLSSLVKQLGAENVAVALSPVYKAVAAIVHNRGGEIIEFQPDKLTALWGIVGEENFALKAVRAAIEMRESIKQYRFQATSPSTLMLGLKAGLDQGRVVEMILGSSTHQAYSVIGPPVLQAAHFKETASAGDIKVSKTVYDWTRDMVVYEPCCLASDLVKGEELSYLALGVGSE